MNDFKSDFYLKPLNIRTKSGLATWHADTDPAVHDLFDGFRTEAVNYTRKRRFDGTYQDCQVIREEKESDESDEYDIILLPGDGSRYLVKKVSSNNKINDDKTDDTTEACVICMEFVKNHVCIPCGHLISCTRCTKKMDDLEGRCPICRVPYEQLLRIFK